MRVEDNIQFRFLDEMVQNDYLGEEVFRGTKVSDRFLVSRGDHNGDIAVGIEIVLVPQNLTRILSFFAWIPLCGN